MLVGAGRFGNVQAGGLFYVGDIGDQHRVVGGHGAPRLGDDVWVRQVLIGANFFNGVHDVVRVFLYAVVHGTERTRTCTLVIHPQPTTHVEHTDIRPLALQLGEITHRLAHAGLDILDVGNLRAHVEVHHLQAIQHAGGAQPRHYAQYLGRRQAEFGFIAAGILPLAGAYGRQAHAHAEQRRHIEGARLLQHHFHLGQLLHHDVHAVAQLFAYEGEADVFAVLVAVAYHHRVRA